MPAGTSAGVPPCCRNASARPARPCAAARMARASHSKAPRLLGTAAPSPVSTSACKCALADFPSWGMIGDGALTAAGTWACATPTMALLRSDVREAVRRNLGLPTRHPAGSPAAAASMPPRPAAITGADAATTAAATAGAAPADWALKRDTTSAMTSTAQRLASTSPPFRRLTMVAMASAAEPSAIALSAAAAAARCHSEPLGATAASAADAAATEAACMGVEVGAAATCKPKRGELAV
mmetsp:Transcript_93799/g.201393  ORF Transcript_93799/g.201393 Transcript_93799/m.201393 type:complete len:239 (-) Transcript_93799:251-967(-)